MLNDLKAKSEEVISYMQRATGVTYSQEQLDILNTPGGMCILASAGSGKTTVLTHLIAKRIQTGEIADTSKLLCTTFSKGGADEMSARLQSLLKSLGITRPVFVKTLHAIYLQVLKDVGYDLTIVENSTKMRYIREACKDCGVSLEDDEYQTLESIFGFQINNLMSDAQLYKSYAYTLREKISLETYSNLRQVFNAKKQSNYCMDFDDMQLFVYSLLKSEAYGAQMQAYCKSLWHYIYIDEAQDISKIQFEILKLIISDPTKLVFIGDDDQCLIDSTKISTCIGDKEIKDIETRAKVKAVSPSGEAKFFEVDRVSKKPVMTYISEITTESGKKLCGTDNHIGFAVRPSPLPCDIRLTMFSPNGTGESNTEIQFSDNKALAPLIERHLRNKSKKVFKVDTAEEIVKNILDDAKSLGITLSVYREAVLNGVYYAFTPLGMITEGMEIPAIKDDGTVRPEKVVDVNSRWYCGIVYDLSVPSARNFIADGIVVHNCIYQWRGADPSIILNICGVYTDLTLKTLTTNYRCKQNIVDPAAHGIEFNSVRSNKTMKPYSEGGKVSVCDIGGSSLYEMSKYAYKLIKTLVIDQGVSANDIAVLSRNNTHLTILNNLLFQDGIYCQSAENMKFTGSKYYKMLKGVVDLVTSEHSGITTSSELWKVCLYMKRATSKDIGSIQNSYGMSFKDTLGFILTQVLDVPNIQWENPGYKVTVLDSRRFMSIARGLANDTVASLSLLYTAVTEKDAEQALITALHMFYSSKADLFFKGEDPKRTVRGYIEYMCDLIERLGVYKFKSLMKMSEQYETGSMAVLAPKITLSTMHGAKGKEWKHVIMFADDNVSFPSFQNIRTCLENEIPDSDIRCMIDEDRRLHYVAMTRAKENLYIMGDRKNFGIYTLEALGAVDFDKIAEDKQIMLMAQHGVYQSILDKGDAILFSDESPYRFGIDIKSTDTEIEKEYKQIHTTD